MQADFRIWARVSAKAGSRGLHLASSPKEIRPFINCRTMISVDQPEWTCFDNVVLLL